METINEELSIGYDDMDVTANIRNVTSTSNEENHHPSIIQNQTKYVERLLFQKNQSCTRKERRLLQLNTKLLEIVEKGDIEHITRLLKNGANPNATCQLTKVSACHIASLTDNFSLGLLVQAGAISNRTDRLGRTPIHYASWAGNTKQIAILLGFPQDLQIKVNSNMCEKTINEVRRFCSEKSHLINMPCQPAPHFDIPKEWQDSLEHDCPSINDHLPHVEAGWSPLHCACSRAQYASVQFLLATGADACALDDTGREPLDVVGNAYYLGHTIDIQSFIQIVKCLLKAGARINNAQMNDIDKVNTPLHTAVELESETAIMELLNMGASATCLNIKGLSAMHICVEKRLIDHLQLLVNFEYSDENLNIAVVDIQDLNGLTILNASVRAGWSRGVRVALGAWANITIQANDGDAPIHSASANGDKTILQLILDVASFGIDLQNKTGQTALFIAIINGHPEVVKLLLQNHASIEIRKPYYINVLHFAARHGDVQILQILFDYIGNELLETFINRRSGCDCYPPIVYAVDNNHPLYVEMLLEKGAQIDIEVPYRFDFAKEVITTPLHIAVTKKYLDITKILLNFNTSVLQQVDSQRLQPLHVACINGERSIITLLIQKGADLCSDHENTQPPIQILMETLSNPIDYLEEVLNSLISTTDTINKISISYKMLIPNGSNGKQLKVLNALCNTGKQHNHGKLLLHPLIESFFYLKWISYQPLFFITLAVYGLYTMSLSVYIVSVFFYEDKNKVSKSNSTYLQYNPYPKKPPPSLLLSNVWQYMIYVSVSLIAVQEIICIKFRNKRYYLYLETWVKYLSIVLAIFLPSVVTWRTLGMPIDELHSPEWVRVTASIAVLLSWLITMFLLARFPSWGHYALMLGKVTAKVLKVTLTFGILIVGFSLCFLIQFRANPPFEGPWASLTKTLVILTSEFDYATIINKDHAREINASVGILRVSFIIFIVFASIVLMNVLVGVAVSDVRNLEKRGKRIRLQKELEFLISMENIVFDIIHPRWVIYFIKNIRQGVKSEIVLNPNDSACTYGRILPKNIKRAIYEKAQLQIKQKEKN